MSKIMKTSAENRKCAFPGCKHTLSIYNHEDYCHVHLDQLPLDKGQKHKIPFTFDKLVPAV